MLDHPARASVRPCARPVLTRALTRALTLAAAASLLLPACGKSESAPAPSDTTAPLAQGRSVSRPNQIQGTWMAITQGDLAGIEFLKDNQAMLTGTGGLNRGTRTLTYNIIDDGRLSLVDPQGITTVYRTIVSGDVLELNNENSGATPQRFQRVPEGQTLAQAAQAHEARMVEEMQQRILALQAMLTKGGAVLAPQNPDASWTIALEFEDLAYSLNGRMILDERPGRPDPLSPVLVLPFQADTSAADRQSSRINIVFNVGQATEPAGVAARNTGGPVRLTVEGPVDKPTIAGSLHFRHLASDPIPVQLRLDPDAHAATLAALEHQRAAVTRAVDAMRETLGGRSTYTGLRTVLGNPNGEPVALTIEYNEPLRRYDALITTGNRIDQAALGAIDVLMGQAALYIVTPWGEQWRLQNGDEPGMLFGPWRPSANADFLSHGSIELTPQRRWTAEEVTAERAAIQNYLSEGLASPQRFVGFVERAFGATNVTRWPVSLELQTAPDNSVTGSVWMIAQHGGVALGGTRADRQFTLTSGETLPDSVDFGSYASQRWQLEFTALDPVPTFVAQLTGTRLGGGSAVLTPATPEAFNEQRDRLLTALTDTAYASRTTDTSTVRDDGNFYVFTPDPATGRVTGEILGNNSKWTLVPPALFNGAIVDDHGMPVLKGVVTPAPDPARGNGQDGQPFDIALAVVDIDGVLHLTGSTAPIARRNQDWFLLTPTTEPIEMDDARRTRLAALKVGASAVIPTDPMPGDQVTLIINVTDRDANVGQLFYADGKYTHRNSVPAAAIHAGLAAVGEMCVVRLTYGPPFTEPVTPVEQHGVTSQRANFRENNPLPTFTIERIPLD